MLGKLSIIGVVGAILLMPTALPAQAAALPLPVRSDAASQLV